MGGQNITLYQRSTRKCKICNAFEHNDKECFRLSEREKTARGLTNKKKKETRTHRSWRIDKRKPKLLMWLTLNLR